MSRPRPALRPDLDDVEPYVSPQLPARVRLNTNESPYPPPPEVVADITERLSASSLNRYPDRDAPELVEAIARRVNWPSEGIWLANGSNEVLLHLFLAFGGPQRTSVTFEPTYPLHTLIGRIAGNRTLAAERTPVTFDIDAGVQRDAMQDADIVVFCSPNNPTGGVEDRATVERALERVPLVIVDEAYIEFAGPGASVLDMLADHPNLVVVRTFSKAWSLAGVRLGYALASPEVISAMASVRLPYSISTFSQFAGLAALRHAELERERIAAIVGERDRLVAGLSALGLSTYPSSANFVLFDAGDREEPDAKRTERLWNALMDRGVLVRNYASHPQLAGCLRVTAGLPEETQAFLIAMEEVLR